jgi:hypothetical protein
VYLLGRYSLLCLARARWKVYLPAGKYVHELQTTTSRSAKTKFGTKVVFFLIGVTWAIVANGHGSFLGRCYVDTIVCDGCNVECDGGGVDVVPRARDATMHLDRIRVATCDEDLIDGGKTAQELTAGKDDRVFRPDRVGAAVCTGMGIGMAVRETRPNNVPLRPIMSLVAGIRLTA